MSFVKYQHVERLGTTDTMGIEEGLCFIFPKLDGTNSQLWYNEGLQAGSRNRHLKLDDDNAGFYNWALSQENLIKFFHKNPDLRLFGEWLVPHTLRTYQATAWRRFYVFDVMREHTYLPYEEYKILLDEYNIDYVAPICKIINPTYERILSLLEKNTFLIEDGKGTGEGVVVKNYEYKNRYGRVTWGKIVKNEFKDAMRKNDVTEVKEKRLVEEEIVTKFVTEALVKKEFSKIESEVGWSSKLIPRLLNTIFYCLVKEEAWNFVKEFKNPTVDFKKLNLFTVQKIKTVMPELF